MPTTHRGARALLITAALFVVLAGLKAAAGMLSPLLVAGFLAVLCIPPMRRLQAKGLPEWGALLVVMIGATLVVILISVVIGSNADDFRAAIPKYQARLTDVFRDLAAWLTAHGIEVDADALASKFDSSRIMQLAGTTAASLISALSNVILVLLTMIFVLLEVNGLTRKLRRIAGPDLSEFSRAAVEVQKYLAAKTVVSVATGICAGVLCFACGVDFPLLWALLAFLFNFVPNIGSVIAAIPAVLIAILEHGVGTASIVGGGYLVINMVIGNVIEPKLLGRRLGLSTLVVFLSLVFFGWILGPVGMLLSVPLTVVLKIVLEHSDDFQSVAILLGPGNEEDVDSNSRGRSTS